MSTLNEKVDDIKKKFHPYVVRNYEIYWKRGSHFYMCRHANNSAVIMFDLLGHLADLNLSLDIDVIRSSVFSYSISLNSKGSCSVDAGVPLFSLDFGNGVVICVKNEIKGRIFELNQKISGDLLSRSGFLNGFVCLIDLSDKIVSDKFQKIN